MKNEEDAKTAQAVASALIKRIVDYKAGSIAEKQCQGVSEQKIRLSDHSSIAVQTITIAVFSSARAARVCLRVSAPS